LFLFCHRSLCFEIRSLLFGHLSAGGMRAV
jgi:hypothetical protein